MSIARTVKVDSSHVAVRLRLPLVSSRRLAAGAVTITYEITVPLERKSGEQVSATTIAGAVNSATPDSLQSTIEGQFESSGLPYEIEVTAISPAEVIYMDIQIDGCAGLTFPLGTAIVACMVALW